MSDTLADKLATIAKFAAEQKARLQSVTVGDVSFVLVADAGDVRVPVVKPEARPNLLEDPTTYGLPEGAALPGYRDPRKANQ